MLTINRAIGSTSKWIAITLACIIVAAPAAAQIGANPERFVVVGDSLTAGFQNFSLFDSDTIPFPPTPGLPKPGGQKFGYAALVAHQAGINLKLPLFTWPGIPPALVLGPGGVLQRGTTVGLRENPAEQTYNLSVPGFTIGDALAHPFPGTPLTNPIDAMSDLILATPGNVVPGCGPIPAVFLPAMEQPSAFGVSELACAIALRPTIVLVSLGNNDALQTITAGIPPTNPLAFAARLGVLLTGLAVTRAKIVVSNIPDVTVVPFLVPVPTFMALCRTTTPPSGATLSDFIVPNISDPAAITFNVCTNYSIRPAALVARAQDAVHAYNNIIHALAGRYGAAVVDVHQVVANLARHGYPVGGKVLTTAYLGGLFSLDAIHPTNTGYAIIANETIKTMNTRLRTAIPLIDVAAIAATDPQVP